MAFNPLDNLVSNIHQACHIDTVQLTPWLCIKGEYMFLIILVPRPRNPKDMLEVCLQPLVTDFKDLWENRVET